MLTVDANIVVYSADSGSSHHQAAMALLRRLPYPRTVLLLQTLGEVANVSRKRMKHAVTETRGLIQSLAAAYRVHSAPVSALDGAWTLLTKHKLSFWDAFMLSTAADLGCHTLLSCDMSDRAVYGSVRVLHPFKDENAQLLAKAIAG